MRPPFVRIDAPPSFELWRVDLAIDSDGRWPACLDASERARAARFVFERDRRRYLAAHWALRQLLSSRTGLAPDGLQYVHGPFGKPSLAGDSSCTFNLSHSADLAAIALCERSEIGVDVEMLRPMPDAAELARIHFTIAERTQLAGAADPHLAFLRGWTRKEACLKAIGSGLSIAANSFDAGLSAETRVVRVVTPAGARSVEVHSLSCGNDAVVALAKVLSLERKVDIQKGGAP